MENGALLKASPRSPQRILASQFTLLSLNTFGIPFYLGWGRLLRLARELDQQPAHMLCLQELQQNFYASLLERMLRAHPHAIVHRNRLAPKGGLGAFSRIPPLHHDFEVYQDRGTWRSIGFADWALYKGVLFVHLRIDDHLVIVLNTHMHANYTGDWRRKNRLARLQHRQVLQLSRLIAEQPADALVILCGDLNFPRASFLYEELLSRTGLADPLAKDQRATYRPFPLVPSTWKVSLDYVLVRYPEWKKLTARANILPMEDTTKKLAFQRFLTDHCALTLQVGWES